MKRKRQMNVTLSNHEFSALKHLADQRGVTVSDEVRALIRREFEVSRDLSPLQADAALGAAAKEKS